MIIPIVAVLLLAIFAGTGLLLVLPVLAVAWLFFRWRGQAAEQGDTMPAYADVSEVTQRYGEPDDVVTLDASRANELGALILFYTAHDIVIVTGHELKLSELTGVAPKNMATPYTIDEYAVIINTSQRDCPTMTLRVGYDAGLAGEIASQIDAHLRRGRATDEGKP